MIAKQPTEARAALDAGRAILVKFVADHPDFAQWTQDLAWFDGADRGAGEVSEMRPTARATVA